MITTFTRKRESFLFCLVFLFSLFLVPPLHAQEQRIKTNFRSPVDFPLYLSGTFGELRADHFHSGIDIKTEGVTGKKVHAVADGYISRINVSLTGYGNALYITHPDGYVSVYGHLEQFNAQIRKFVRTVQYHRQSFTLELFPPNGELPVKKGEVIAYSGESGGADGPHLHFEVREAKTEFPVNPLLFQGIHVVDHRMPKIYRLAVYKKITGPCKHVPDTSIYLVSGSGKECHIRNHPVIKVTGPFSLGLESNDVMDHISNHDGDYSIRLYEDNQLVWGLAMNKISFYTTRYINSLIDYNYYEKTGRRLVRTQIDTNNRVPNYFSVKDEGVFRLHDKKVHHFRYEVADIYGNTSVFKYSLQEAPVEDCKGKKMKIEKKPEVGHSFRFNRDEKLNTADIRLNFPKNSFYRSLLFRLKIYPEREHLLSQIYEVGSRFVPVQRYFDLAIKVPKTDERLVKKLYIAYAQDRKSHFYSYAGGKYVKGWLQTKARTLGCYAIKADTVRPDVRPINFKEGTHLIKQKSLRVMIQDKPAGIRDYRPTLNGHWILMEYLPKKKLLIYHFDQYLKKGKNEFRLVVHDMVGNATVLKATLYRK